MSNEWDKSEMNPISDAVKTNVEKVQQFEKRHDEKRSRLQKIIERVSVFFGSPSFFLIFVACNVIWVALDVAWHRFGHPYFDDPPFPILQGFVTYVGVLITMAVLIRQNRLALVEESRAHLDLQVNLLSEQKATKIIMLLEELRRDMPNVQDRHDDHVTTLQATTNPDAILSEFEGRKD